MSEPKVVSYLVKSKLSLGIFTHRRALKAAVERFFLDGRFREMYSKPDASTSFIAPYLNLKQAVDVIGV